MEAEHPAEADRHVRIAAEVVVHLHQIGARSDPRADDRELAGLQFKRRVDQQEINGLLTPDRKPKIDPERFAKLTTNPDGRYC